MWCHLLRLAQHGHGGIDQVAAQLEHRPAGILRQRRPSSVGNRLADHGVQLKDFPQPALADGVEAEPKRRIVAKHVAHLHGQAVAVGLVEDGLEGGQRGPGRLIQVNVLSGGNAPSGGWDQVPDRRLDGHGLQGRCAQKLLFGHPLQVPIGRMVLPLPAKAWIGLDDAHDLIVLVELPHGADLSGGVGVSHSDLPRLDPFARSRRHGHRHGDPRRRASTGFDEITTFDGLHWRFPLWGQCGHGSRSLRHPFYRGGRPFQQMPGIPESSRRNAALFEKSPAREGGFVETTATPPSRVGLSTNGIIGAYSWTSLQRPRQAAYTLLSAAWMKIATCM